MISRPDVGGCWLRTALNEERNPGFLKELDTRSHRYWHSRLLLVSFLALILFGCTSQVSGILPIDNPAGSKKTASTDFTLQTGAVEGRMVYVGMGGDIDGIVNPDLVIQRGDKIHVTLINGDGIPHDLSFPDFAAKTPLVSAWDTTTDISFTVNENQTGSYAYYCTVSGHRQAGMEGKLIIGEP